MLTRQSLLIATCCGLALFIGITHIPGQTQTDSPRPDDSVPALEERLKSLLERYAPDHPQVKDLQNRIDAARRNMATRPRFTAVSNTQTFLLLDTTTGENWILSLQDPNAPRWVHLDNPVKQEVPTE